jgi:predicted transcriptional regulator of viral defense system
MPRRLGPLEAQFLAYAQMRGWTTVRTGDLQKPLRLTPDQERTLLSRLARSKLIARVWRGLYLVPPALPVGGTWSPSPALALTTLMEARGGRYQVCGPNAFYRYGYTQQIPNRIYAYNTALSGTRRIGAVSLSLIKVAAGRLGDTDVAQDRDQPSLVYSSRARTLVDAVYDWARFDSLPRAYDWIREDLAAGRVTPKEIAELALRYGDVGTVRRIGALLAAEGVANRLLRPLEVRLRTKTSMIPWIPRRGRRGSMDRRWGVLWNDGAQ